MDSHRDSRGIHFSSATFRRKKLRPAKLYVLTYNQRTVLECRVMVLPRRTHLFFLTIRNRASRSAPRRLIHTCLMENRSASGSNELLVFVAIRIDVGESGQEALCCRTERGRTETARRADPERQESGQETAQASIPDVLDDSDR